MMPEKEKQYIVEQRALGATFAQIGQKLGRSKDSVRVMFNRIMEKGAALGSGDENPCLSGGTARCKNCGSLFSRPSGSAKRLFCSDRCRNAWCNEQKRRTPHNLTCEYCGREFIAFGNPHKRFCSRQCFADSRKEAPNG